MFDDGLTSRSESTRISFRKIQQIINVSFLLLVYDVHISLVNACMQFPIYTTFRNDVSKISSFIYFSSSFQPSRAKIELN